MRFPGWIVLVPAATLVGCAAGSAGSSVGMELSPLLDPHWQPFVNQTCSLQPAPAWAEAPERLVQLDAAQAVLAQSEGEGSGAPPRVVLEVRFGDDGLRRRARVVESNILEKRFVEASDLPAVNAMVNAAVVRMEIAPPIRNRSPDPGWSRLPISVVVPASW
jgi:hypothetical protein